MNSPSWYMFFKLPNKQEERQDRLAPLINGNFLLRNIMNNALENIINILYTFPELDWLRY